jgi:hypothetical protein
MRLGEMQLHVASDGGFRLDGGAMSGVISRALWERKITPNERAVSLPVAA